LTDFAVEKIKNEEGFTLEDASKLFGVSVENIERKCNKMQADRTRTKTTSEKSDGEKERERETEMKEALSRIESKLDTLLLRLGNGKERVEANALYSVY